MISTYCSMFASMEAYNILSEARLNLNITSSWMLFFLLDMLQLRNKSNLPVCNKILIAKLLKNNLNIVLALFTRLNLRFSRLDTTTAFQATSATSNWVQDNSSQP